MKYFIIKTGYGELDFVSIDETELESAIQCFIEDSKCVFKNGVVRGRDIIAIREDYHKAMGWNYSYKLTPEDYGQINKKCKSYVGVIATTKERVEKLIRESRTDQIGQSSALLIN